MFRAVKHYFISTKILACIFFLFSSINGFACESASKDAKVVSYETNKLIVVAGDIGCRKITAAAMTFNKDTKTFTDSTAFPLNIVPESSNQDSTLTVRWAPTMIIKRNWIFLYYGKGNQTPDVGAPGYGIKWETFRIHVAVARINPNNNLISELSSATFHEKQLFSMTDFANEDHFGVIDPEIFQDDDAKIYLHYTVVINGISGTRSHEEFNRYRLLSEFDQDGDGVDHRVYDGYAGTDNLGVAEAPTVVKMDGRYVMLFSARPSDHGQKIMGIVDDNAQFSNCPNNRHQITCGLTELYSIKGGSVGHQDVFTVVATEKDASGSSVDVASFWMYYQEKIGDDFAFRRREVNTELETLRDKSSKWPTEVHLSWNQWDNDPNTIYSLDIVKNDGSGFEEACVSAAKLKDNTSFIFKGVCPGTGSSNKDLDISKVYEFVLFASHPLSGSVWNLNRQSFVRAKYQGDGSIKMFIPNSTVELDWAPQANTQFSLDVETQDGTLYAPCINANVLGGNNTYTFNGYCDGIYIGAGEPSENRWGVKKFSLYASGPATNQNWIRIGESQYHGGTSSYIDTQLAQVVLSWPVSPAINGIPAIYSLDVVLTDGTIYGPCINAGVLQSDLLYKFEKCFTDGDQNSSEIAVDLSQVSEFVIYYSNPSSSGGGWNTSEDGEWVRSFYTGGLTLILE